MKTFNKYFKFNDVVAINALFKYFPLINSLKILRKSTNIS